MNLKYLVLFGGILFFTSLLSQDCDVYLPKDMTGAVLWGNGTPASCTQSSLQTLITTGGKILCNCGSDSFTLKLSSTLIVPGYTEVIIDGQGKTIISGENNVRIFDKKTASSQATGRLFGVQNMVLRNGYQSKSTPGLGGSAIYGEAFGSLYLYNVRVENNHGPATGLDTSGAIHTIVYKEAIFVNCKFLNNSASNAGAVGCIGTSSKFINCLFEGNEAVGGSGGAVSADGVDQGGELNPSYDFCSCIFRKNHAKYQSGALSAVLHTQTNSTLNVNHCVFDSNSCDNDNGGAIYYMYWHWDTTKKSNNMPLTGSIQNSQFTNNSAKASGGAIWTTNTNTRIENCTFYRNKAVAGLGGAVCHSGGTDNKLIIVNCTLAENLGGIFASGVQSFGSLSLCNTIFVNQLTGDLHQQNAYGGAVINKNAVITMSGKNLQFPKTFKMGASQITDYWITADVLTVDPQLLSPDDYGGNTKTMAIIPGSPVINQGTSLDAPLTDQRGRNRDANPDLGAYEYQGAPSLLLNPAFVKFDSVPVDSVRIKWYTLNGKELLGPVKIISKFPFMISLNASGPFDTICNLPLHVSNQNLYIRYNPLVNKKDSIGINHHTDFAMDVKMPVSGIGFFPNHPPDSIWISNDTILEKKSSGTFIAKIVAHDNDTNDNVSFAFCSTNEQNFLIRKDSLFSKIPLIYATADKYSICISAADKAGSKFDKNFVIRIIEIKPVDTIITNSLTRFDESVVIYPNPSAQTVFISCQETVLNIKLFTSEGILLKNNNINNTRYQFDVDNLANGIYLLELEFENNIVTKKISIHH